MFRKAEVALTVTPVHRFNPRVHRQLSVSTPGLRDIPSFKTMLGLQPGLTALGQFSDWYASLRSAHS